MEHYMTKKDKLQRTKYVNYMKSANAKNFLKINLVGLLMEMHMLKYIRMCILHVRKFEKLGIQERGMFGLWVITE